MWKVSLACAVLFCER